MALSDTLQNILNRLPGGTDTDQSPTETSANDDESTESDNTEPDENTDPESDNLQVDADDPDSEDPLTVTDLEYEIEDLNDQIGTLESTIRTLRTENEEMEDEMGELNDRVRNLLGVYDRLTENVNPFKGTDGDSFNITDQDPPTTNTDETPSEDDTPDTDTDTDDSVVSFEDIRQNQNTDAEQNPDSETESSTQPASEAPENKTADGTETADSQEAVARTPDTFLTTPPDSFAADLIAFEWITELIQTAGTAGTLKAIVYYEDIEWISPEIRAYLETMVSGPGVETGTISQAPEELSSEHHKQSYRYIMKLAAITNEEP